jgi:hypothetical protein
MDIDMTLDEANTIAKESFHDLKSFEGACLLALSLSEESGLDYIGIDRGEWVWPQYGVILAPRVGEDVSYTFNGDYYPCGQIKSISKSLKLVTTTTGRKFYRRRLTGSWINDNTWTLISGYVSKRNPSF